MAVLSLKPPLPGRGADPPNVKGVPLVPLQVVWVVAPKADMVAVPMEKPALVLPVADWLFAVAPKATVVDFKPPRGNCGVLPATG